MLHLGFRAAARRAFGSALAVLVAGVAGCTAGVQPTHQTGTGGGSGGLGLGGSVVTGLGGFTIGGNGGSSATGTGGTLPVPPGCGDGINNQGGIEDCDDGNTIAG